MTKPPAKLLSSGNPQIAMGYGDGPVQAYIAAMPGWKRPLGERLDALIMGLVPDLDKAVKWNTPLYGRAPGWFLGFYCYKSYISVSFFRGRSLTPMPPVASKSRDTRYLHIHESDPWDQAQLTDWIMQASLLPGEPL
ncbi:MAG: DUF1801 domain-containing protein [bacterium]